MPDRSGQHVDVESDAAMIDLAGFCLLGFAFCLWWLVSGRKA